MNSNDAEPSHESASRPSGAGEPAGQPGAPEGHRALRSRSIWRFRFVYGLHDPILWICIGMTALGATTVGVYGSSTASGVGISLVTLAGYFVVDLAVLSVIRWPIAVMTRSLRLGNSKSADGAQWAPDPTRLAEYRWWDGGVWTNTVAGPAPRPSSPWLIVAFAGGLAAIALIAVSSAMTASPSPTPGQTAAAQKTKSDINAVAKQYKSYLDQMSQPTLTRADLRSGAATLAATQGATQQLSADIAAMPPGTATAQEQSNLNAYVKTGTAAISAQRASLNAVVACGPSPSNSCIDRAETVGKKERAATLSAWRQSMVALGLPIKDQ